jgi:hypothetical protein
MLRKSLLLVAALVFAPVAAFAVTAAPIAKSDAAVTTAGKMTAAPKTTHKARHQMLVKKQKVTAKTGKLAKTPATKS